MRAGVPAPIPPRAYVLPRGPECAHAPPPPGARVLLPRSGCVPVPMPPDVCALPLVREASRVPELLCACPLLLRLEHAAARVLPDARVRARAPAPTPAGEPSRALACA